jgi:hypothetical protein
MVQTRLTVITLAVFAVFLSACGGGGDQPLGADANTVAGTSKVSGQIAIQKPLAPDRSIPSDAHIKGMFSRPVELGVMPIHMSLLPDGRVFYFGSTGKDLQGVSRQGAHQTLALWNPAQGLTGGHEVFPNEIAIDMFCTAFALQFDGSKVLMFGGDTRSPRSNFGIADVTEFSPSQKTVKRSNAVMHKKRWYATATTLPSGDIYIQGGKDKQMGDATGGDMHPEVSFKRADGSQEMRSLTAAATDHLVYWYPRNFVAPNGLIFGYDGPGRMYWVDPAGEGRITNIGSLPPEVARGTDSTATMFEPGRILQFGGSQGPNKRAHIIDIRGTTPQITETGSLAYQRGHGISTVLPNGHVLATGGARFGNVVDSGEVAYEAEIWNPKTGVWTVGAKAEHYRLYHSSALLLPDATVVVGGGGLPGPTPHLNMEVFFPPYLFTSGGKLATRPTITGAPTVMDLSRSYRVNVSVGPNKRVARMALVRTGSASHSFNNDQRFLELSFAAAATPGAFTVHAPRSAADAPPGMYMLFALDDAGVPSVAAMVRLNPADTAPPPVAKGLRGEYFNNLTLSGPAVTTRTEVVNFDWGSEAPGAFVTADRFSVRWTGTATAPRAGNYVFETRADDGVRLWIDDRLVIDRWLDREATLNASPAITLRANQKVKIRMEYYDNEGYASAQLRWRLPGASAGTVIPSERLSPP